MTYKVKLDIFEGPFDLLVYLIENARMNIYDIQVSEITRQYLDYLKQMEQMDVTVGGEFMVLAAALIEIKSKMLLPRMKTDGEISPEEDPRSELVERLLEYKKYKSISQMLEQREALSFRIFEKPKEDISQFIEEKDPYLQLDLDQFVKAFLLFVNKKKKVEQIQKTFAQVERQKQTIESKIKQIKNFFTEKLVRKLSFRELLHPESKRYDVVLTFVSLLEMIRQKSVRVKQVTNFGEISVSLVEEDEDAEQKNH